MDPFPLPPFPLPPRPRGPIPGHTIPTGPRFSFPNAIPPHPTPVTSTAPMPRWYCKRCDLVMHESSRIPHLSGKRHTERLKQPVYFTPASVGPAATGQTQVVHSAKLKIHNTQWYCKTCDAEMSLSSRIPHLGGKRHAEKLHGKVGSVRSETAGGVDGGRGGVDQGGEEKVGGTEEGRVDVDENVGETEEKKVHETEEQETGDTEEGGTYDGSEEEETYETGEEKTGEQNTTHSESLIDLDWPDLPAQQSYSLTWTCTTCDETMNIFSREDHLTSKIHDWRVRNLTQLGRSEESTIPTEWIWECKVCEMTMNVFYKDEHLVGSEHRAVLNEKTKEKDGGSTGDLMGLVMMVEEVIEEKVLEENEVNECDEVASSNPAGEPESTLEESKPDEVRTEPISGESEPDAPPGVPEPVVTESELNITQESTKTETDVDPVDGSSETTKIPADETAESGHIPALPKEKSRMGAHCHAQFVEEDGWLRIKIDSDCRVCQNLLQHLLGGHPEGDETETHENILETNNEDDKVVQKADKTPDFESNFLNYLRRTNRQPQIPDDKPFATKVTEQQTPPDEMFDLLGLDDDLPIRQPLSVPYASDSGGHLAMVDLLGLDLDLPMKESPAMVVETLADGDEDGFW